MLTRILSLHCNYYLPFSINKYAMTIHKSLNDKGARNKPIYTVYEMYKKPNYFSLINFKWTGNNFWGLSTLNSYCCSHLADSNCFCWICTVSMAISGRESFNLAIWVNVFVKAWYFEFWIVSAVNGRYNYKVRMLKLRQIIFALLVFYDVPKTLLNPLIWSLFIHDS